MRAGFVFVSSYEEAMRRLESGKAKAAVLFEEAGKDYDYPVATIYWIDPALTKAWSVGFPGVTTYDQGSYYNFHTTHVRRGTLNRRIRRSLWAARTGT